MVLSSVNHRGLTLVMLLIFSSALALHGQKVERMMLKEALALWENVEIVSLDIDTSLLSQVEGLHQDDLVYCISDKLTNELKGHVLLTSAMGRFDAFDYFVIFNDKVEIQQVTVAVYRSSHGGEICNKHWLKQFKGYKGGGLIYGKDVQSVSGATISAGSIVTDIHRAYMSMDALSQLGIL